jgi:hypothetical protein
MHHAYSPKMQQAFAKNSCWIGYLCGAKQVVNAFKNSNPAPCSDASLILGWLYYFDVMARFSFRHWRTEQMKAIAKGLGFNPQSEEEECALQYILARDSFSRGVTNIAVHAHPVVELLAEVSETAMYSSEPRYLTAKYQLHLEDLRLKLETASALICSLSPSVKEEVDTHAHQLLELTRLAGLIYLERISRNFSRESTKLKFWTRQALSILKELDSCLCPFALFIVGCEATEDEDRMIILNLYMKMEARPHLQGFMEIRSLLRTAWTQQDLAQDGELGYIHKLNLVMSSRDVVPSLI